MRIAIVMLSLLCANVTFASPIPSQPIQVKHPEMLQLFDANATLEALAEGFQWSEGPVVEASTGAVFFSDVPTNKVYRWHAQEGLRVYLEPSGYTALDDEPNAGQGANGLIFNQKQQLVLAQHGDRRLALLEKQANHPPQFTTLVSHYQGLKLNSPNDVVQHPNQSYYFTDPPYGLRQGDASAQKQLPFNGVFRLDPTGQLTLLVKDLTRPNGLAFSPDQQWLYIANSDRQAAQWWRFAVAPDGSLGPGEIWFDATEAAQTLPGLPDGLKVLRSGHVLATGPGGVWVFDPTGKHLGSIQTGVAAANVALSADERQLFITASNYLLRIQLK